MKFAAVSSDFAWHFFECGCLQKRQTALQERTKYTTYFPETENNKNNVKKLIPKLADMNSACRHVYLLMNISNKIMNKFNGKP